MAGLQKHKDEIEALGGKIIAGSVDAADKLAEAAPGVTYPVAVNMTRDHADAMRAWWGDMRGGIIQPSEFIIGADGKVVHSLYASGPVGRMAGEEIVNMLKRFDQLAREAAQKK